MYPTVVILLVETQRSMSDVYVISPPNGSKLVGPLTSGTRPATLGHLSSAVGTVHSTTDKEAEYRRSRTLQSRGVEEDGLEITLEIKLKESQADTAMADRYS